MEPVLIDTDTLSYFLRGDEVVAGHFDRYLKEHSRLNLSVITYYEITSGLQYKDANRQLEKFVEFVQYNNLLYLTRQSCEISSKIYAELRKQGNLIDDIDLLIAGIAKENNLEIITRNTKHFERVKGLIVTNWCQ